VVGQVHSWKLRGVVISHSFAFSASRRLSTLVSILDLSPPLPVFLLRVRGLSRLNTRAVLHARFIMDVLAVWLTWSLRKPLSLVYIYTFKMFHHFGYNLTLSSLIYILYCAVYNHGHISIAVLSAWFISRDSITGKLNAVWKNINKSQPDRHLSEEEGGGQDASFPPPFVIRVLLFTRRVFSEEAISIYSENK
jgi:hypothetical protein